MKVSQKIEFLFYVNGGNWREQKQKNIFLQQSLFFHKVPELVQALVIIYDEIFPALTVQGDVLFPKPFLDRTQPNLQLRHRPLRRSRVWQTEEKKNISEAGNYM
jgi:hypothetical protein